METISKETGTYAGVKFSEKTKKAIRKYIKDNNIPNRVRTDSLHTTLLFSRKHLPDYEPAGTFENPLIGNFTKFVKWPSQPTKDGTVNMCLVLKYKCPELVKRHNFLMNEHGATYDFDKYKPHITLSYNVGGLQCKDLPNFEGEIEIIEEYYKPFEEWWCEE